MSGKHIDTLIALVERGPLDDGSVPSKSGRNDLVDAGLAARVIVNGEDGFNAATYAGREAYLAMFGADTIREGTAMRRARNAISEAQYTARGGK
jgi:hypothetical protein